ncbi:MAG: hypothetical protein P4M15_14140 [Alphaproteobacteria bacterium]|nr:hypothetical protein [Alphaproteobacteria bacterium]
MKAAFIPLFLAACLAALPAPASNLNTESTLVDQGIAPRDPMAPAPKVLDGIPLMQELQEAKDRDLLNILPGGDEPRTSFVAVGIVDVDDVYNFYKKALPSEGWQATGARDYKRGGQYLHINAQANGKLSTVTFTETGTR